MKRILAVAILLGTLLTGCSSTTPARGGPGTPESLVPQTDQSFTEPGTISRLEGASSLRITRFPGSLMLPVLDRTITDPDTIARLQNDIDRLPVQVGVRFCTIDFGTTYTLIFRTLGEPVLTAVVSALGCRDVQVSDGRTLSAATSTSLYADLRTALGLTGAELIPFPCPPFSGTVCYPERSP